MPKIIRKIIRFFNPPEILPPPDRSTQSYADKMDQMARYRARISKQG